MSSLSHIPVLIKVFLKIGLTSFGGHAALIAMVQEELIQKKKFVDEEVLLKGISIASILPGPLAVNVVSYLGYQIMGWLGALVCFASVLIPPFILMVGLAELNEKYGDLTLVRNGLIGVTAVIVSVIISVCIKMFRKNLSHGFQYVLFAGAFIAAFFYNNYWAIVILMTVGGISGLIFSSWKSSHDKNVGVENRPNWSKLLAGVMTVMLLFTSGFMLIEGRFLEILIQFTRVSLTLFGGGYVMVPILFDLLVNQLEWISTTEFTSAIAFGQMTPGPILVSATYVGYILEGIPGAFLGTIGIFLPSAVLMIVVSELFKGIAVFSGFQKFMEGVYPVVIAYIAYSAWIIYSSNSQPLFSAIISLVALGLILIRGVNHFVLIIIAGVLGMLTVNFL